jgi:predicted solute-binding protein
MKEAIHKLTLSEENLECEVQNLNMWINDKDMQVEETVDRARSSFVKFSNHSQTLQKEIESLNSQIA